MTTISIPSLQVRPTFLMQSEHYTTFSNVVSSLSSITLLNDSKLPTWDYLKMGTRSHGMTTMDCYAFIYSPLALGRTLKSSNTADKLFVVHAIFDHMQSETQSLLKWEHVDEFGWLTAFKELKWGINVQEEFKKWEAVRDNVSTQSVRKMV